MEKTTLTETEARELNWAVGHTGFKLKIGEIVQQLMDKQTEHESRIAELEGKVEALENA